MAVRFSVLRAGRPHFTSNKIPGAHLCWRLSRHQGHSACQHICMTEHLFHHIDITSVSRYELKRLSYSSRDTRGGLLVINAVISMHFVALTYVHADCWEASVFLWFIYLLAPSLYQIAGLYLSIIWWCKDWWNIVKESDLGLVWNREMSPGPLTPPISLSQPVGAAIDWQYVSVTVTVMLLSTCKTRMKCEWTLGSF
jgi:hypothetical protein